MFWNKVFEQKKPLPEFVQFTIEFLEETGIRPKELWQISKSSLDYLDGKIRYTQPKTEIIREIQLSPEMLNKARRMRKQYGNFAKHYRTYKNLKNTIFYYLMSKINVKWGHNKLYIFRYLYVLNLIRKGFTKETISKLLGHNEMSTVRDYIKHAENINDQLTKMEGKNG